MSKIADFLKGWFGTIGDNELEAVSTMRDPSKLRLAVEEGLVESNLGAISFNTRRPNGTHDERAYLMGRMRADLSGGAVYLAVQGAPGEPCREVLYIDSHIAIFRVPVQGLSGSSLIQHPGNKFATAFQPDGNVVTYRCKPDGSVDVTKPVWSSGFSEP